jgi:hypothetical protein
MESVVTDCVIDLYEKDNVTYFVTYYTNILAQFQDPLL